MNMISMIIQLTFRNYVKDKLYEDVDMKNYYIDDEIKIINKIQCLIT